MPQPRLILLGPRGSGKTTAGRLLAQRLGVAFLDLDEQIQHDAGRSIADIFAAEGEAGFRQRESAALAGALESPDWGVLATGGGVVLDAENRRRLRAAPAVRILLLADPQELCRRIAADPASPATRPALSVAPCPAPSPDLPALAAMRQILAARLPAYREVCDAELDVTALPPADVAARCAHALDEPRA